MVRRTASGGGALQSAGGSLSVQPSGGGAGGGAPVDVGQLAVDAREAGLAEVVRLLGAPEDLARVDQLRAEVASKLSTARAALTSAASGQEEAAQHGMALLDKSHRHVAKLRTCIDRIDELCDACSHLVEHHDKIRALSHAHRNVAQVLEELGDILDLPLRAAAVQRLLSGLSGPAGSSSSSSSSSAGGLVAAFEGLTVLTGAADNIKEAWRRNAKKSSDLGELAAYLTQVGEAWSLFESRLWALARGYHSLALAAPRTLVDVARVVEMQEQMDAHYISTKAAYVRPRHFRERLGLEMEAAVAARFGPLHALCGQHGAPNATVKRDQAGNIVLSETRDYLGGLVDVERVDAASGRPLPGATDAELAAMQISEEAVFDEAAWLDTLLNGLSSLEAELAAAYDHVAPCFPPHFCIFDAVHQMYHVQFAQAMDAVGAVAPALSTSGQLALMQWVCGYQQTLRGLGVQEELVRLPVAPLSSSPEGVPGFAALLGCYMDRMTSTMTDWFNAILAQDLAGQPQQLGDGTLRTPGVIDFFRMLNEQVSVLEEVSRGEVLLAAARRCLALMQAFVDAQATLADPISAQAAAAAAAVGGSGPGVPVLAAAAAAAAAAGGSGGHAAAGHACNSPLDLSFEMVSALLNNSVDCYHQALELTEHVQSLLDEEYRASLDAEDVVRAFLGLAKAWSRRLVGLMYADEGLAEQWRKMYCSADWLAGTTTGTLLATLGDYFGDVSTFVEPGFARRTCEAALDELVRRSTSRAVAALDRGTAAAAAAAGTELAAAAAAAARSSGSGDPADAVLARLVQDERDVRAFFERHVHLDRLVAALGVLGGLRELLDARDAEAIAAGYGSVVAGNPAITPTMVERMLAARPGLSKVQAADVAVQCRELHGRAVKAAAAAGQPLSGLPPLGPSASASAAADGSGGKGGWRFWKSSSAAAGGGGGGAGGARSGAARAGAGLPAGGRSAK